MVLTFDVYGTLSCLVYLTFSKPLLAVHHARQLLPKSLLPVAAQVALTAGVSSYFTALASSTFCRNLTTISHLCSAGRQLLRGLHGFVPSGII